METASEEKAELNIRLRLAIEKDDSAITELRAELQQLDQQLAKERRLL
ncbi:hypothetical protein AB4483_20345 [Vibrio splendidus]